MRFSVLEAHMPTESSAVFTNCTNGVYPIREKELYKSSRKGMVYFRAPNVDQYEYQNAYDIDHIDLVADYGIIQKFTGQSISSDFYTVTDGETKKVSTREMLKRLVYAMKYGMKTMYYENFKTSSEVEAMKNTVTEVIEDETGCEDCKL